VTASPAGALHTLIMFVMWLGDETGAGAVIASSDAVLGLLVDEEPELQPGDFAVYHLYAQESFRVSGTCAIGSGFSLALDIAAPAGWSLVKYGHGGDGPGSIRVETIAAMPQGAQWRTFSD